MTGGKIGTADPPSAREMPVQFLKDAVPEPVAEPKRARERRPSEAELAQEARGDKLCGNCVAWQPDQQVLATGRHRGRERGQCRFGPESHSKRKNEWCMQFEAKEEAGPSDEELIAKAPGMTGVTDFTTGAAAVSIDPIGSNPAVAVHEAVEAAKLKPSGLRAEQMSTLRAEGKTLKQIGEQFGISGGRVGQILKKRDG